MFRENKIKCPFPECDNYSEPMDLPSLPMKNISTIKMMQSTGSKIHCANHNDQVISYYCSKENVFTCVNCCFDHSNHKQFMKNIDY